MLGRAEPKTRGVAPWKKEEILWGNQQALTHSASLATYRFFPLTCGTNSASPEGTQCQSPIQFQHPAQSPACLGDMIH